MGEKTFQRQAGGTLMLEVYDVDKQTSRLSNHAVIKHPKKDQLKHSASSMPTTILGVFFTDYLGDLTCTSLTTASFSCPKMGIAAMSMSDGEGDGKLTSCRRTQAQQQQQQHQQQRSNRRKRQRNAFFSWLSLDSHNHAYTCIRRTVSSRITEKMACWVPTGRRQHTYQPMVTRHDVFSSS